MARTPCPKAGGWLARIGCSLLLGVAAACGGPEGDEAPVEPGAGRSAARPAAEAPAAPSNDRSAPPSTDLGALVRGAPSTRPNVVIYLVDALRAQNLGTYGYPRPVSPSIDAFAKESIVFERAYAQSPWTRPSVASLFTGQRATSHGVTGYSDALPLDAVTLAERMSEAGYETAAFVTNPNMATPFGLHQGFEVYGQKINHLATGEEFRASRLNLEIATWLHLRDDERPFFLYVHTIDPHAPYDPPEVFRDRFAPNVDSEVSQWERVKLRLMKARRGEGMGPKETLYTPGSGLWIFALTTRNLAASDARVENLRSLYDSEIASNDRAFGSLIRALEKRGLLDDTLVLFVADHGEEFYEHGSFQHGPVLYDTHLRIPFILRPPGGLETPHRERERIAQQVDVLPTILDFVGAEIPTGIDGRSLLRPATADSNRVHSHVDLKFGKRAAVIEWPWKLVRTTRPEPGFSLYDLERDPDELEDLYEARPEIARRLAANLIEERGATPSAAADEALVDDELRNQLEALGYVQ